MYWQRKVERDGDAMTLNNTYKLLLPYHGLLGSLFLQISGNEISPHGAAGGDWRIIDEISNISIVANGSTVIKSLTGYEVAALAVWDQGVFPPSKWRNYAANTQFEAFLLNFGRWFKDAQMGLDLSQYSSVELWITNTATAADYTSLAVKVVAYYLQDVAARSFPAYMRTEEWQAWVTVQDGWVYNNLPTERLIRRIMLQAIPTEDANAIRSTGPANLMDEIKFSLDTGNVMVLDDGLSVVFRENFLEFGHAFLTAGWPYVTSGHGVRMGIGEPLVTVVGGGTQAGTVATVDPTVDSARSDDTLVTYGYLADHPNSMLNYGLAPHNTGMLFMHDFDDPNTYLDPKARATVKLDIHTRNLAAAAGGRNAIVLDRLVPNGQ